MIDPVLFFYVVPIVRGRSMQVADIMTKQVECCSATDSLERAAQRMWDNDCGCLPVCDAVDGGGRTVGVVTDRDICMCALFKGRPLSELAVSDAMAKQVLTCQPQDTIDEVEAAMRRTRIRRVPVLDDRGALVGMITLADLARNATRGGPYDKPGLRANVTHTLAAICAPREQSVEL
jgi:CBS domain-containing protein